jgi:hypothetical protein
MKPVALFLILAVTASAAAIGNIPPRVDSFMKKVEMYYDKHPVNWTMPNIKPSPADEMPSPVIVGMMTMDPETGLAFSPSNGNLYDPELEVGLEAATGIVVDFKTGEKYALKEILKERQKRNKL